MIPRGPVTKRELGHALLMVLLAVVLSVWLWHGGC